MNKVIGYVRVSTNEQFSQGGSVQAQENMIRAFCKAQNLELINIYSETTHVSTRVPMADRPEGGRVVEIMDNPRKNYGLVIVKLDRAFRSTVEAIGHINNWGKSKSVYILDFLNGQKFDSRDPMMKMTLSIMAVFAELERDSISKRTKVVLADKKESRTAYCAKVYGYDRLVGSDELIPNPAEQKTLELIFRLYAKSFSLRQIAEHLNTNGHRTSTGKKWYASTIKYILSNDLYKDIVNRVFAAKSL